MRRRKKLFYRKIAYGLGLLLFFGGPCYSDRIFADQKADAQIEVAPFTYQDLDYEYTESELESFGQTSAENQISLFSMEDDLDVQGSASTESALPVAYGVNEQGEITDQLPSLKNQGSYGNCWAFSALGASEAGLIQKGYADASIDLSERQLTYYFFNKGSDISDALGGTKGDYNENVSTNSYWNIGGNSLLTIWQMASWCGPVKEELAPFSQTMNTEDKVGLMGQANSNEMAYGTDAYHLQNAYVLSIGSSYKDEGQRNLIKEMILKYGALGMSYYAQRTSTSGFDNVENNCYYNNRYTSTNHAIQVVGWDDRFSKENFNASNQPEGDGAWLMKNSWGEEGGDKAQTGYFWLSYYDYSLRDAVGATTKYAYVFDLEPADRYDQIYQHDGDAGHKRLGNESGVYYALTKAANVFAVSDNSTNPEYLEAVGIGESRANISYTLSIYTDVTSQEDPTAGVLALEQSGVIPYNGYHTIPLTERVYLSPNSRYSVVFTFEENGAYVYASRNFTYSPWKFTCENHVGESFFIRSGSSEWLDCAKNDLTEPLSLRIKGYTSFASKVMLKEDVVSFSELGQMQQIELEHVSDGCEREGSVSENSLSENSLSENSLCGNREKEKMKQYHWISRDESIVSVNEVPDTKGMQAVLCAKGQGFTTVTALDEAGGVVATCYVTALKPENTYLVRQAEASDPAKEDSKTDLENQDPTKQESENPNTGDTTEELNDPITNTVVLKKITNLSLKASLGKVKLSWKKNTSVDGYAIYRATSKNGTYQRIKRIKGKSKTSALLAAYQIKNGKKTAYYYKVCGYKVSNGKCYYGIRSNPVTYAPKQTTLLAKRTNKKTVKLTWKRVPKADGYILYRKVGNKKMGIFATISGRKNTTYLDKEAKKGRKYSYKIRAYRLLKGTKIVGISSNVVKVKS